MTAEFVVLGVIWYIAFLFSTTCHEGAHALVAKLGGDPTAFLGGQVTLNPLPHIRREPFGLVVVPLVSYFLSHWMVGWASAPYNPEWQARHPRRAACMALAGPGANFVLMLLAGLAARAGISAGIFHMPSQAGIAHIVEATAPGAPGLAATSLSILFVLNLLLGTFNLLPVPPLDGHTGITLLMSEPAALRFLSWTRRQGFGFAGLLLAWILYGRIFGFLFVLSLRLIYPGSHWR